MRLPGRPDTALAGVQLKHRYQWDALTPVVTSGQDREGFTFTAPGGSQEAESVIIAEKGKNT
jgi:hypothetical protein